MTGQSQTAVPLLERLLQALPGSAETRTNSQFASPDGFVAAEALGQSLRGSVLVV